MQNLKGILQSILKSSPKYEEGMLRVELHAKWEQIVGDRLAKHCWPVMLCDDGTLILAAESNAWLQNLRYLERQIIEKIKKEIPGVKISQVRFRLEMSSTNKPNGNLG